MTMPPVITTKDLTKRFGKFTAVDNLSLNVRKGEIYGFLGLNGAGKTTTIRMLLGMIKPGGGSVALFGEEVAPSRRHIWERVGYLVETPHHYPDLTVRENLEIYRRLRHIEGPLAVDKIIEELSLTPYIKRFARHLSLGNAQRLGLAKALLHRPDLLILDEPANALDPAGIVEIRNLLRGLAENNGVTIFISSHILSEIARLATRIGIIHEGRLIKEIDTAALLEQEEPRLAVGVADVPSALSILKNSGFDPRLDGQQSLVLRDESAINHPEQIATLLVRANNPPHKLAVERSDLEAYFLKLVGGEKEAVK